MPGFTRDPARYSVDRADVAENESGTHYVYHGSDLKFRPLANRDAINDLYSRYASGSLTEYCRVRTDHYGGQVAWALEPDLLQVRNRNDLCSFVSNRILHGLMPLSDEQETLFIRYYIDQARLVNLQAEMGRGFMTLGRMLLDIRQQVRRILIADGVNEDQADRCLLLLEPDWRRTKRERKP
jgi:hypothetical protein